MKKADTDRPWLPERRGCAGTAGLWAVETAVYTKCVKIRESSFDKFYSTLSWFKNYTKK